MKVKKEKKEKTKVKAKSGTSKKEIRSKIQESVNKTITSFHIESPSKKTKRAVKKVSYKIAGTIKRDLKRLKNQKKTSLPMNGEKQKTEATA